MNILHIIISREKFWIRLKDKWKSISVDFEYWSTTEHTLIITVESLYYIRLKHFFFHCNFFLFFPFSRLTFLLLTMFEFYVCDLFHEYYYTFISYDKPDFFWIASINWLNIVLTRVSYMIFKWISRYSWLAFFSSKKMCVCFNRIIIDKRIKSIASLHSNKLGNNKKTIRKWI